MKPKTIVGEIDNLLDDCTVDEIAVLLGLEIAEVDRIARLLREVGPPDPDPLPVEDIQDAAEQVAALDEPGEGWPRIGTSPVVDRGQTLRQVQAATVVIRRATSGTDLDDLAGALGIRHALEVAERAWVRAAGPGVMYDRGHGDDTCRCIEIAPATLAQPAEWEQADDCPIHPLAVVDPAADRAADRRCTRQPGCPWVGDVECGGCNGDEDARRARYDADERPALHEHALAEVCDGSTACAAGLHVHGCFADAGNCEEPQDPAHHVHDPFPVADERGIWRAECECGTRWDGAACDACGGPVSALHIARTGSARHAHHGEQ
jgi:hypothetical protein